MGLVFSAVVSGLLCIVLVVLLILDIVGRIRLTRLALVDVCTAILPFSLPIILLLTSLLTLLFLIPIDPQDVEQFPALANILSINPTILFFVLLGFQLYVLIRPMTRRSKSQPAGSQEHARISVRDARLLGHQGIVSAVMVTLLVIALLLLAAWAIIAAINALLSVHTTAQLSLSPFELLLDNLQNAGWTLLGLILMPLIPSPFVGPIFAFFYLVIGSLITIIVLNLLASFVLNLALGICFIVRYYRIIKPTRGQLALLIISQLVPIWNIIMMTRCTRQLKQLLATIPA